MARIIRPITTELNWEVESGKLYNAKGQALKDYKLLTRSDNGGLLNVCKKTYTPTTNDKFKETVNQMQKVTGYDFAGFSEMGAGRKILAYLKAEKRKIAGFDFDNYMVIGNSHDYSTGFFIATSKEMLRCENQFSRMYKGSMFSIPHTISVSERIDELVMRFESFMEHERKMERKFEIWKEIDIDQSLREMMVERVLAVEMGEVESLPKVTQRRIDALQHSIDRETRDIGQNLFGLFNGVTHYTTHVYNQRESVFGNIFGRTSEMNNIAYSMSCSIEEGTIENVELPVN
ncbi:DUF932 domain-containing protein [Mongoliitalea daihaiensis]|uniref:DUF932 domain-containing protein n=1 Tax=Mongoliitalea daihaiensis TaxID=2782006 RepID=UPI001F3CD599|nr:DUF932 domain-containing protein [Mongoliitalea daihaiensis]UJP64053.1 DUF932 domain-containing protein [Mongoliitalea daihaiensis]